MRSYLDFYTGSETGFKVARTISKQYEEYPVLAWRVLFTEIVDQLMEFDGVLSLDEVEIDQEDEDKKKMNLKKSKELEPQFHCELKGEEIVMDYLNVAEVDIKYYVIDPEVLFSRTPFLMQETEDFSYAKPMVQFNHQLDKSKKQLTTKINAEYLNKNMVIEVLAVGK